MMENIEKRLADLEERVKFLSNDYGCDYSDDQLDEEGDEPEIDWEERREREEAELALNCKCGAWQFSNGGVIHVADCCCGAE